MTEYAHVKEYNCSGMQWQRLMHCELSQKSVQRQTDRLMSSCLNSTHASRMKQYNCDLIPQNLCIVVSICKSYTASSAHTHTDRV